MRFVSFLSGRFITAIVVNPLERKLAKRISVQCLVVNCDDICDMREVTAENSKISPTYINKQVVGPSLYRALQEAAKAKRIHGNGMLLLLYIFECETHDELTSTTTSKELFLSEILPSFCSTLALNTSYYCYGG